jgi:SAM-dependent methyltransferase
MPSRGAGLQTCHVAIPGDISSDEQQVLKRELEYHEKLYSGFAQTHFARPAVRRFRAHSANRILQLTSATPQSRVLSLGCGIADTEMLIAPHVRELVGVDLSPAAVQQAKIDAKNLGLSNIRFEQGTMDAVTGEFDAIIGIFFIHHLSDHALAELPRQVLTRLKPGGVFYSLDPSASRLSGKIGRLLIPSLMKKYETEDERELEPEPTAELFRKAGFQVRHLIYDFGSTPLAGLLPGWGLGYDLARKVDDVILKIPALSSAGSNFEIVAQRS